MESILAVLVTGIIFEALTVTLAIGAILLIVRSKFKAKKEACMRTLSTLMAVVLTFVLTTGTVPASEYEKHGGKEYKHHERYESKIYGTVKKIPEGGLGTWVVNGKEVLVTKDTFIKEERGKATVGAYVEVKGSYDGKTFTAYKIEVKRARR